jgi:DNA repair exonuclease SbcCD ATPase subunit
MKFIQLAFENIGGQSKTIDFGNKISGCVMVAGMSGRQLSEALRYALFGAMGDYASLTLPARILLKFETGGESYTLIRLFEADESGSPSEKAVLSDLSEINIIEEGSQKVNSFVSEKLGLSARAFEKLFYMDRSAVGSALAGDASARESFVAEAVGGITTLDEIISKIDALKTAEKAILDHMDAIEPVTRKALKEQRSVTDADKVAVDSLKNDIAAVHALINKAAQYEDDLSKYYLAVAKLEKLSAQSEAVEKLAERNAFSREANALSAIYTQYQTEQQKISVLKKSLGDKKAEKEALQSKINESKQSIKKLEQKFIYHNEKTAELDKALRKLLADAAKDPDSLKIDEIIENYYAGTRKTMQELEQTQSTLNARCNELKAQCEALQARKLELRNNPEYKKAVQDGAVLEAKMSRVSTEIAAVAADIQKHEKEQAQISEKLSAQAETIRALQLRCEELERELRNGKKNLNEAENAVVLYSQSIYGKHIMVSSYEAEIKAIEQKIERLKATIENFNTKRGAILQRKKEVLAHIEKLEGKRTLLMDKLTAYIGYNRLKEYSDAIEYGSRCPLCDNFVTFKKDIPVKDTGLIQEQIDIVDKELAKDKQALAEADQTIEQYDTNLSISNQYIAALNDTKAQKQAAIAVILSDFGVKTTEELYQKTSEAAEAYKKFLRGLNEYHETEAELRRLSENNALTLANFNVLTKEVLPAAKEQLAVLNKEITELGSEYEKILPLFNEETAADILVKLQILETEYAKAESELEAKQQELAKVTAECEENLEILTLGRHRAAPVIHKGERYSYKQVIVKSVAEVCNVLLAEIDENEEQKEITKVRLSALKKLAEKYKAQAEELAVAIAGLEASVASAESVAEGIYAHYREKFVSMGVASQEDLEALVVDPEILASREKEVLAFRDEISRAQESVNNFADSVNSNLVYHDELNQNRETLALLEDKLQDATARLSVSNAKLADMSARYDDLVDSNRKLSVLQEKLRALEELSSAISDGAVIAKDFARLVIERASKKIQRWTSDRYSLEISSNGQVALRNNLKGKPVSPSKFNKEEKMLLSIGLSNALTSALSDLLVTDLTTSISVSTDETDKSSLAVILEAAKEKDIIVLPEDDNMFFRAVSKLA